MSFIAGIGTALPKYQLNQMQIYQYMSALYNLPADHERKHELLYQRSGISKRYSCVPDYDTTLNQVELYDKDAKTDPFPSIEKRMDLYFQHALPLSLNAVDHLLQKMPAFSIKDITHIITVSCTGMSAPGLDILLLEALNLGSNTERTSVNFMGCYAAVHGLKQAHAICQNNTKANVLLLSVELCTLHFQKKPDYDNLTANALFGDGAAAVLISGSEPKGRTMEIKDFYSELQFGGKKDMAWQLSSTGFLMTLSSYIPQLVEQNILQLIQHALHKYGLPLSEVSNWAIHPGGRKILEVISAQLNLSKQDLNASYEVLKNYGNMSSPTILFVLAELLYNSENTGPAIGTAFGPGLTMETFLMDIK
ncbi:MAG: type III polyketide synthase [bacterium]|nr:type III polyketide synthase [bacterium]